MFPDHFLHVRGVGSRRAIERALVELRPGVTEVYVHPAVDTAELRSLAPDWAGRVDDHDLVTGHTPLRVARRARRCRVHRLARAARPPALRQLSCRGN